jgi:glycine/D-amino acid oxidase-like deaminating enzyme
MKYDIWTQDSEKRKYPELDKNLHVDVAIIGGGITGVLTAYFLARAGKKVALLEKKQIGHGATQFTTAFLTQSIDTNYTDLIKICGKEKAKKIIDSHQEAIDVIEGIIQEHKIACDFKRVSNFIYALEESDLETLKEEFDAMKELGVDALFHETPITCGFDNKGGIEIKNQAKFHPLKFVNVLAEIAFIRGALLYEETQIESVTHNTDMSVLKTATYSVVAKHVISATYEPFEQPLRLFFKKGMYVSYVLEAEIEKGILKEGLYEDTENPYHYVRVDVLESGKDRIIAGGEDHREDVPVSKEKNIQALEEYVQSILKGNVYTITRRWDGPILEPSDGLAFIGPVGNENMLYAFGFSGNGMTYAALAARILSDHILENKNPYAEIYAADRIPTLSSLLTKGKDYAQELIHGAVHNSLKYRKNN